MPSRIASNRFGRGARPVGILDAQQEFAAAPSREQPVEQSRAGTADMQHAGRRGGKTGDDGAVVSAHSSREGVGGLHFGRGDGGPARVRGMYHTALRPSTIRRGLQQGAHEFGPVLGYGRGVRRRMALRRRVICKPCCACTSDAAVSIGLGRTGSSGAGVSWRRDRRLFRARPRTGAASGLGLIVIAVLAALVTRRRPVVNLIAASAACRGRRRRCGGVADRAGSRAGSRSSDGAGRGSRYGAARRAPCRRRRPRDPGPCFGRAALAGRRRPADHPPHGAHARENARPGDKSRFARFCCRYRNPAFRALTTSPAMPGSTVGRARYRARAGRGPCAAGRRRTC